MSASRSVAVVSRGGNEDSATSPESSERPGIPDPAHSKKKGARSFATIPSLLRDGCDCDSRTECRHHHHHRRRHPQRYNLLRHCSSSP